MNWRAFLPGLVILAIAWVLPLALTPILILLHYFHINPDIRFVLAWGYYITLPGTLVGLLALIVGVLFTLARSFKNWISN